MTTALAGYLAAGPFIALHRIQAAADAADAARLEAVVDFPLLRSNLKQGLMQSWAGANPVEPSFNPLPALKRAMVPRAVNVAVDAIVTPQALARIVAGRRLMQSLRRYPVSTAPIEVSGSQPPAPDAGKLRFAHQSATRFSAWIKNEDGSEVQLLLFRQGLDWRLGNLIL